MKVLALILLSGIFTGSAFGDVISFNVSSQSLSTSSGGTVTFDGTVTNDSGADLNASDFFFNFFGFDPNSVTPVQDLGIENDFLIPTGGTSGITALFDVQINLMPAGSTFPIQVQLEDINSDLSSIQTVTVTVSATGAGIAPEPSTWLLLGTGVVGMLALRRKRKLRFCHEDDTVPNRYGAGLGHALLLAGIAVSIIPTAHGQSPGPAFSTQPPIVGNSGSTFFVFLPVANIGTGPATNMQLTSIALTYLGAPAAVTTQPATLPYTTGSGYLAPGGVRKLDLEFNNTGLVGGNTYLLTLRGTYQTNGSTYGFALNRPVIYANGFAATHQQVVELILAKFETRSRLDPQADDEMMVTFVTGLPQVAGADLQATPPVVSVTFNDGGQPLIVLNNVKLPAQPILVSGVAAKPSPDLGRSILPSPMRRLRRSGEADPSRGFGVALHNEVSAVQRLKPNAAASAVGAATELPGSSQMRVLNAFGTGFPSPASDLEAWLTANGYQQAPGANVRDPDTGGGSVTGLKAVGGYGVFYISTHAGFSKDGYFNIWTTTPWKFECEPGNPHHDECKDPTLTDDISDHLLVSMFADNTWDNAIQDWRTDHHYAITAAFIDVYWGDFATNAFVYLDACESDHDDPRVRAFRNELFTLGASVVAGWTGEVGDIQIDTAKLVFDRLLGANQFCPEDGLLCHQGHAISPVFAQRPFDYSQVVTVLPLHNCRAPVTVCG
jgi:hypothetical protein